jgi:hypothetical protein
MAQIVIFAPAGEDVSAGEAALKEAGHEVEVVEATAANLLHMAIGMVDDSAPVEDQPVTEPTEEEPAPDAPPEAPPAEEPPTSEAIGEIEVDGEKVMAYLDTTRTFPLLRVVDLTGDNKLSYKLNESAFTFWREPNTVGAAVQLVGKSGKIVDAEIAPSTGRAFIILDPATAKHIGLV